MPPTLTRAQVGRIARPAGALYLAIIILGLTSELAVRSALHVPSDPQATAAAILGSEVLFRASILADAAMAGADIALAVLLFFLLRPAGLVLAALAAAFRLSQTAVIAGNLMNQTAALLWLTSGADPDTAAAIAYQALELHGYGYDLGLIFFGVNSVLTGVLLIRSEHFLRLLGQMLIAAGIVYLIGSALRFLAPDLAEAFAPVYLVAVVAETSLAIRLVTFGLRRRLYPATA